MVLEPAPRARIEVKAVWTSRRHAPARHARHPPQRPDRAQQNAGPALLDAALVETSTATRRCCSRASTNARTPYGTTPLIAARGGGHHRISALPIASAPIPTRPTWAARRCTLRSARCTRRLCGCCCGHASPDRLDRHGRLPIDDRRGRRQRDGGRAHDRITAGGQRGAGLAEKREMRERARVDEAARRLERAETRTASRPQPKRPTRRTRRTRRRPCGATPSSGGDAATRAGVPRPMTAPETPAAPTPVDAEAEAARLRARDTYRKQADWRGRFNPLLGRARPDHAPGETSRRRRCRSTRRRQASSRCRASSGTASRRSRRRDPPVRDAPPQLVVAPPAGQAMAKMAAQMISYVSLS